MLPTMRRLMPSENGRPNTKRRIQQYVQTWEKRGYPEGIPDEADSVLESHNKVASYRMICRALLSNDVALQTLGFSRQKCEAYMMLKKIEIDGRG